jgi:hypothetical protein
MTTLLTRALPILVLSLPAFAVPSGIDGRDFSALRQLESTVPPDFRRPPPPPPAPVDIAVYTTDEEFTFDNHAKAALDDRIDAFRRAGITPLGGRVMAKPNRRHTFAIDYIPKVDQGTSLPAALVSTYRSAAAYWRENDAEEAMLSVGANLRNAGIGVLGYSLVAAGQDHSFAVDFLVSNVLRPTAQYEVQFQLYMDGKYTFESEAAAAVAEYAARFDAAGVPVIRGRAVQRTDRDYAVELQYAVRTNQHGPRPLHLIARYDARETYPFEDGAAAAAGERMPAFAAAGVPAVHGFARKAGRDYSFSVDYLVRQIYQGGSSYPSAVIKVYQSAETFTSENEATTAMEEKAEALRGSGFTVIGAKVVPSGRDYTYVLDYIAQVRTQKSGNMEP